MYIDPYGLCGMSGSEMLHTVLDVIGWVDPTGIADGVNAVVYVFEGDYGNAMVSGVSMIPFGDVLKLLKYGGKYGDDVVEVVSKRVNLPAWKKIDIDIDHIASGHMKGGSRASSRKDLFPDNMSRSQIEKSVRKAYKHGQKVETQGDRVRVVGQDGGLKIEMWVNTKTRQIETAYPIY
jgi:hypothetical protein